jgi:hypothetical protein
VVDAAAQRSGTITVLFTDVVDSTVLRQGLGATAPTICAERTMR